MEIIYFTWSPQNFPNEFLEFCMVQLNVITVFLVAFITCNLRLYYSLTWSKFSYHWISSIDIVREEKLRESKYETCGSTEKGTINIYTDSP